MQELQNVNLDQAETGAKSLNRVTMEEELRRRRNQASGGNGVQFSTIFSIVDSGLENGAESIRRLPKHAAEKSADPEKSSFLPIAGAADEKAAVAEAAKEAPKAKAETEQKPRVAKEAVTRKSEAAELLQSQIAAIQAKIEQTAQTVTRVVERAAVRTEKRDSVSVEKARSPDRAEHAAENKDHAPKARTVEKPQTADDGGVLKESAKGPERKERPKARDNGGSEAGTRDDQKSSEMKSPRGDDEHGRSVQRRDRAEEKSQAPGRAEPQDAKASDRKVADGFDKPRAEETPTSESAPKKKTAGDFEKLTGLHARTVLDYAPIMAPVPVQDLSSKTPVEIVSRGLSVEAAKAGGRIAASQSGTGSQQNGGAMGQSKGSDAQTKLAESARRLNGYVSGKLDAPVNSEATFSDLVSKAKMFLEGGRSEMTIQLKPEHLGNLNIKISMEDGQMEAKFVTDRPEVQKLLEQHTDVLKEKLNEAGIVISAVSVEVRSDAGQTSFQGERSGGLRKVTVFGSGEEDGLSMDTGGSQIAYALAGMGTHLSLVA